MPKGNILEYLFNSSDINKPLEEVWADIQSYTGERFPENPEFVRLQSNILVVLPPLKYKGKFLKGVYISNAIDYIQHLFPQHKDIFITAATSMWSSYPWSKYADIYLTSFDYPQRLKWYKKNYPQNSDKIFIPLMDTDFTHELVIKPVPDSEKDIDIISVGRLDKVKNLPLLVKALVIFEKKFGYIPKTTLITGSTKEIFDENQKDIIREMADAAGSLEKLKQYITFVGEVPHDKELWRWYSRAKCSVLTSIFEGKNRMVYESLCCNTPVVIFKDLCKYTRGNNEILPENSGLCADFNAESLANKLKEAIDTYKSFTPRQSFLKNHGRLKAANRFIEAIPYYRENIPDFEPGKIEDNSWINSAMQEKYQLTYKKFLYGHNIFLTDAIVNEKQHMTMDFYLEEFNKI